MEQKIKDIRRRAAVVAPNLWMLFWLFIPSGIVESMTETQSATGLQSVGRLLSILLMAAPVILLWRMVPASDLFRPAALGLGGYVLLTLTYSLIPPTQATMVAIFTVLSILAELYSVNYQCRAYAQVLEDIDGGKAAEWLELRKMFLMLQGLAVLAVVTQATMASDSPVFLGVGGLMSVGAMVYGVRKVMLFWSTLKLLRELGCDEDGQPIMQISPKMKAALGLVLIGLAAALIIWIGSGYLNLFKDMGM